MKEREKKREEGRSKKGREKKEESECGMLQDRKGPTHNNNNTCTSTMYIHVQCTVHAQVYDREEAIMMQLNLCTCR